MSHPAVAIMYERIEKLEKKLRASEKLYAAAKDAKIALFLLHKDMNSDTWGEVSDPKSLSVLKSAIEEYEATR